MNYLVKTLQAALVLLLIISLLPSANALKPVTVDDAPPMSQGYPGQGAVSGRVTTTNITQGLPGAYVAIVNAANPSQAFYEGVTDENGFYRFPAVNNTMAGDSPGLSYQVYASLSSAGESLSDPFGVEESSTAKVNVTIATRPAKIVLMPERSYVVADNDDHVVISAYVTDASGYPVEDGTPIDFEVGDTTQWPYRGNGTLSTGSGFAPCKSIFNVTTKDGRANVTFGWVNYAYADYISRVKATYALDHSIYAPTSIYFKPLLDDFYSEYALYGVVQDYRGKPFGSAAVTLHMMGYHPNGSVSEIYTRTAISSADKPYPGTYVFDDIPWNGNFTYGYLTAKAEISESLTYSGISYNFTRPYGWSFVDLYVAMPDAIRLSAQPDTILAGGNQSVITAQLYLNGKPYKMAGVGITFFTDDETKGYLPATNNIVTDNNGRATINLTTRQAAGDVKVSGHSLIRIDRNLTDATVVHIVIPEGDRVTDKNTTGILNTTEKPQTKDTDKNGMLDSPSANPGSVEITATPIPVKSTPTPDTGGSPGIYAALAIVLLGLAGFATYVLAFRKK